MQLVSVRALLGILVAFVAVFALGLLGVPLLVALIVGVLLGWIASFTLLRQSAARAERWLTTPKFPRGR